jgi:hypothetical protein
MNTLNLSTSARILIPANSVELSSYNYCNWLDHHIFKDTNLSPTGYDFVYPQSAYGGYFYPRAITFAKVVSGGPFYDICYQDFCTEIFSINSVNLYCISTVAFILSALDESNAKIIKLIYDFDDKTDMVIKNYDYINPYTIPIKQQTVYHTFYPRDNLITTYHPKISAIYEDGCTSTIAMTLCCFKCGIIDAYENVGLLDSAQTKEVRSIVLTLEDRKNRQLFTNMLDLDAPLPPLTAIPQAPVTIPTLPQLTIVKATSARLQFINPVTVNIFNYEYMEGLGINLTPDLLELAPGDLIYSPLSGGIILIDGSGAPYDVGDGILITPGVTRIIPID